LIKGFEFVDAGRTFVCNVETPRHEGMDPWWFFSLPRESNTRHAPFAASPSDTKQSVQDRIVTYYEELLAIRARPVHPRPQWKRPERKEPAAATETVTT